MDFESRHGRDTCFSLAFQISLADISMTSAIRHVHQCLAVDRNRRLEFTRLFMSDLFELANRLALIRVNRQGPDIAVLY